MKAWTDDEELPEATTWLLEASAGTGKTYQIASLYLRLVAEYGLPVERVLAITFTNAATAELRDRIRKRLADALAAARARLGARPPEKAPDAVLERVLARVEAAELVRRLELALRSFDLAAISTIHGFSQRMLQELAFDSGQDTGLELVADAGEVRQEVVDDTLAALFSEATPLELALLARQGVTRANLMRIAHAMTGATAPAVVPAPEGVDARAGAGVLRGAVLAVRVWLERAAGMRARWDAAAEARAAFSDDVEAQRFKGQRPWWHGWLAKAGEWATDAAAGPPDGETWFQKLAPDALPSLWKPGAGVEARPWWPLFVELFAFAKERAAFFAGFAPLAPFAATVRRRVEAELERRRALTFDAILSRLAERVAAEGDADSPLAKRIRERFDAVFVDEFQDTDDAQWRVLRAAFHGRRRLLLIGDPKQAIYAFRGADVHVYLGARRVVDEERQRTMACNYRSDRLAVEANNALFGARTHAFDEEYIDYVQVSADKGDRLVAAGPAVGLDVRWVDARAKGGAAGEPLSSKDDALVAGLAAREVLAWLRGERGALLDDGKERAIEPGDVAVLVNSHFEAAAVERALARVKVPSVAASRDSVFDTPAAAWLARWLDAVGGGGRDREARTAVVTPLFGWTADELARSLARAGREAEGDPALADPRGAEPGEGGDAGAAAPRTPDWNAWTARLASAAERWPRLGFARTFDAEVSREDDDVLARVLATPDGERHATDLRHLFELCHVEERARRHGPRALADWLRASAGVEDEAATQRLESDARAVRIETVHASKGLEYPIVAYPFGWSARKEDDDGAPLVVRGRGGAELHVDAKGTKSRDDAHDSAVAEGRREALRKQYVALTRARHRTVAWYGPIGAQGGAARATALGRLLLRDRDAVGFDDATMPDFGADAGVAWKAAVTRLDSLACRSEGTIAWSPEPPLGELAPWIAPSPKAVELACAVWPEGASFAGPFRVASFTSLAAGSAAPDRDEKLAADAATAALVPVQPGERRRAPVGLVKPARAPLPASCPPRLERGRGTEYGTCVHTVLSELDFAHEELAAKDGRSLRALVASAAERLGLDRDAALVDELVLRLPAVLATPLDAVCAPDVVRGLPAGLTLRSLTLSNRLDELAFDLGLGDGTAFRVDPGAASAARSDLEASPGCVDPEAVYEAILGSSAARRPGVTAWVDHLASRRAEGLALVQSVAGILTGSIDLVFRAAKGGPYYVVDYKTNRIGESAPEHYAGAWLDYEMAKAGYPLQALLYTLALHRHLRARLAKYSYDEHVGGYLYLFLRGMAGPGTPRDPATGRCLGVLGDRWPEDTIDALDRALSPKEAAR